jgi:two-component system chemotaxis response regulator CheB
LRRISGRPVSDDGTTPSELMQMEAAMADLYPDAIHAEDPPGTPAGLSCPDCHGSLFQISEGGLVRFRCRVGHAWSPGSLLAQQSASHESALWMALRSLEEKSSLTRELGQRALDRGHRLTAQAFDRQAAEARRAATLVRDLIEQIGGATTLDAPAGTSSDD